MPHDTHKEEFTVEVSPEGTTTYTYPDGKKIIIQSPEKKLAYDIAQLDDRIAALETP